MEVRREAPARFVVGGADIVTGPDALAGDFAATSHDEPLKLSSDSVKLAAGYRVWGPARQLEKPAKSALKRSSRPSCRGAGRAGPGFRPESRLSGRICGAGELSPESGRAHV